ncbi:MAG: hypothetical protein R3282_03270 [Rhodothermales bacterium]|nr:hypothetical protein [Rhodothermales bacterium]
MHVLAYLDAGSGSLIIQALVAGVAGATVFIKYRWNSIRQRFRREPKPDLEN